MANTAELSGEIMTTHINRALKAAGHHSADLHLFAEALYGGLRESDLEGYNGEVLAKITLEAFSHITERLPKTAKLRSYDLDCGPDTSGQKDGISIIEIVNDDMPFLLDSVMGKIQEQGIEVYLVVHPVLTVERDAEGKLQAIVATKKNGMRSGIHESFIQIQLERLSEAKRAELTEDLSEILTSVGTVVTDWRAMLVRLTETVTALSKNAPDMKAEDLAESVQFLNWLSDGNFTFLGIREYRLVGGAESGDLELVEDSGLGMLRDNTVHVLRRGREMVHMTPEIRKFFFAPQPLIVTKANVRSNVHRRVHMDYVGIKIYDENGGISGELRIVGLFTSAAYTISTKRIPLLRQKVEMVIERSGYGPDSHSGKALLNVLETYPRDELFQSDVDQICDTAMGIHRLELKPRSRVFTRVDEFDRFVSILVYVPRERYTTEVRQRIGAFLADIYKGVLSAFFPFFPEGNLVRIHFIIGRYEGETPTPDRALLETNVASIVRTWDDGLKQELKRHYAINEVHEIADKYIGAFSAAYEEAFTPERAIEDIRRIEHLTSETPVSIDFYSDNDQNPNRVRVSLYHLGGPIPLSRRVPVLENFGFAVIDERSYQITRDMDEGPEVTNLHDMMLEMQNGEALDLTNCKKRLEECFLAVWKGEADNDFYNQLIAKVGVNWREASAMRAHGSYLRQIRVPFGQKYLCDTLLRHSDITKDLMELFRLRSDPALPMSAEARETTETTILERIEDALAKIPSLDEDRILRCFVNLITAMVRTNFYQTDESNQSPAAIAFKFDSSKIDGLPEPKPYAEIFVYSPRIEGIHLRGGKIARGGLRWSDRAQDFRTEILGLAKAQQVKNTVIVPTGSKGGFVPKRLPRDGAREDVLKEGVACYELFISSLLSVTDNLHGTEINPPANVVRHDGDDPYLVVAADKGTATFSDYANKISMDRGFWLSDAFASGGSAGYDHKKMGITARGAWEAVKRHFREMDVDIQSEPIRVIGVGDMSGDVFGNGMLLSKALKLVAAFDHRDIFIDPDPDPEKTWEERKRLFDMGRSSWQDYDQSLIGAGGGVFSRQAKSIPLSPEMRELTGLDISSVTPNELIQAILKSKVDLLWFGGIGTYIRASTETDDDAGDRANDALRIPTKDLNVKVVGEGANLGMTHLARIEFAKAGGCVNSDAIDNSAGVNSSDLEVNLKIALGAAVSAGKLTMDERNEVLVNMTEQVAEACLRNNYLQTLAISLGERHGLADFGFQKRLMRELEVKSLLNREIEFLPSDADIEERIKHSEPLTRPELGVLLAYSKIDLYNQLIASTVPDDPFLAYELEAYFPEILRKDFSQEIQEHRLRREIIATRLANSIINRGGSTIVTRLKEETGHDVANIANAFATTSAVFSLKKLYDEIDALDNKITGDLQLSLYFEVEKLLRKQMAWFLRNVNWDEGLSKIIELYRTGLADFEGLREVVLTNEQKQQLITRTERYVENGVPSKLAEEIAMLEILADGSDIIFVAQAIEAPIKTAAQAYYEIGSYFRLIELRSEAEQLGFSDYFDRIAVNSTLSSLSQVQRAITRDVIQAGQDSTADFENWRTENSAVVERTQRALSEILDGGQLSLSKLMVAAAQLGDLTRD